MVVEDFDVQQIFSNRSCLLSPVAHLVLYSVYFFRVLFYQLRSSSGHALKVYLLEVRLAERLLNVSKIFVE